MRITDQEYQEAKATHDEAEKTMSAYHKQSQEDFTERWRQFDRENKFFTDADLRYSAGARCKKCGAGLAYPKDCDINHQWTCSNVLKGIGTDGGHEALPFAFYYVKSEDQPGADGHTTRPK